MTECFSCGAEFEVTFSEDFEGEVEHCPYCGEKLNIEVDFEDS